MVKCPECHTELGECSITNPNQLKFFEEIDYMRKYSKKINILRCVRCQLIFEKVTFSDLQ